MGRAKKPGRTGAYIELDDEVLAAMRELASRNGRTFKDEVQHACRRHLGAPPKLNIDTPPLPPAEVQKSAPKRRKRDG